MIDFTTEETVFVFFMIASFLLALAVRIIIDGGQRK